MFNNHFQGSSALAFLFAGLMAPAVAFSQATIHLTPATEVVDAGGMLRIDVTVDPSLIGDDLLIARARRLGAMPTRVGYLPISRPARLVAQIHVSGPSLQISTPAVFGPYLSGKTFVLAAVTASGQGFTGVSNPIGLSFDTNQVHVSDIPLPEGLGWSPQDSGTTLTLKDVSFPDSQNGWIAGVPRGLLHTSNGGRIWSQQIVDPNFPATPTAVEFVDALHGWSVSNFFTGLIYATVDGGYHWQPYTTIHPVNALHFVDAIHGWAVGSPPTFGGGGPISRTIDGGHTWTNQATTLSAELWAVKFLNTRLGIAAGRHGLILYTANGGTSWHRASVPHAYADTFFLGVEAVPGVGVWVVGDQGVILFSADGQTFGAQESGTTATLRSVSFVSATNGWVIGDSGTVLATFDGGLTWVFFDAGTGTAVNQDLILDIDARNPGNAWAVGTGGLIRKFGSLP